MKDLNTTTFKQKEKKEKKFYIMDGSVDQREKTK